MYNTGRRPSEAGQDFEDPDDNDAAMASENSPPPK